MLIHLVLNQRSIDTSYLLQKFMIISVVGRHSSSVDKANEGIYDKRKKLNGLKEIFCYRQ